jgi:hypothetical protein
MTHPITPPLELVQQWGHDANLSGVPHNDEHWAYEQHIATQAAQWGADQELEACTKWIKDCGFHPSVPEDLFAARRPKPPSLKEQAFKDLDELLRIARQAGVFNPPDNIRRALEALPE